MITRTMPEPRCDIEAQLRALIDPAHPKDAVWIARGGWWPDLPYPELAIYERDEGILLTKEPRYVNWLYLVPSDETLAAILGYRQPKSTIEGFGYIVQAYNPEDAVVTEMLVDENHLDEAKRTLEAHGRVIVTDILSALNRRLYLRQAEMS